MSTGTQQKSLVGLVRDQNISDPVSTHPARRWQDIAIFVLAALFVLGYFAVNYLLFRDALLFTAEQWNRAMLLYNGLEAIVFAAAGYLFGQQVNAARAEKAEQQINQAQQRADSVHEQATVVKEELARKHQVVEAAIHGVNVLANADPQLEAASANVNPTYLKFLAQLLTEMDERK